MPIKDPDKRREYERERNKLPHRKLEHLGKYSYRKRNQVLVELSEHVCSLCSGVDRIVVDHDHATGHVRGLLCMTCNWALGLLKDDTCRILRSVTYLATKS